jgi:hypothetical protein
VVLNKAGNSQGGSWMSCAATPWLGADDICVDGSQLGVDNEYTVTYYDANGTKLSDPLGEEAKVIVPRAPHSNAEALANASQWFAEFTAFARRRSRRSSRTAPSPYAQIVKTAASSLDPAERHRYVPRHIGFATNDTSFNQDVKPTATVGVVGTWSADTDPQRRRTSGSTSRALRPALRHQHQLSGPVSPPAEPRRPAQQGGFHLPPGPS